jgi:23S rRNA (guanosine2251-2'-O)-methyltransferase
MALNPKHDVLYGREPVREALRAGRRKIHRLLLMRHMDAASTVDDIVEMAGRGGVQAAWIDKHQMQQWAGSVHHQGVLAEVSDYPYVEFDSLAEEPAAGKAAAFFLILDHIQDPQNVGSLLRTAACAGVSGVIVPADRAVGITPAVVRVSAGAAEHMRVARVVNLARTMRSLREAGISLVGLENVEQAVPYTEAALAGPLALVLGSEGKGIGRLVRETCDVLVRLPVHGPVGSLNVGVAGGVAMYEVCRQRTTPGGSR